MAQRKAKAKQPSGNHGNDRGVVGRPHVGNVIGGGRILPDQGQPGQSPKRS